MALVVNQRRAVRSCPGDISRTFTYTIDSIIRNTTTNEPAAANKDKVHRAAREAGLLPEGGDGGGEGSGNDGDGGDCTGGGPLSAREDTLQEAGAALTVKARHKGLFSSGSLSRRTGSTMSDDILREASGSTLTMGIIGCLPDNVQQAIKSFSIRSGKQHITLCFPFMCDLLKKFKPTAYLGDVTMTSQPSLTPSLFFDLNLEVVSGFQSFVTLVPLTDRQTMPNAMFTLYQRDTTEGVLRHFESLMKVLLDNKTLLSVWKLPLLVMDLSPQMMEAAVDTCAQTILDIQNENLLNTFPEKSKEELLQFIKEKMVSPNIRSYQEHLQTHTQEVASKLRSVDPDRFLSIVDHVRSIGCTAVDYQKADMMMKDPNTDPLIRCFWRVWGQEQVACKVFPIAMASRTVNKIGPLFYDMSPGGGQHIDPALTSLSHVPIKEGLQSIIKSLKSQDINGIATSAEKGEKLKGCSCSVCKSSGPKCTDPKSRSPYWNPSAVGCTDSLLRVQSAFYRPSPSMKFRLHNTSTPYSDALKAAAVLPHRSSLMCMDTASDPIYNLRGDFRRSYVNTTPLLPPYWLPSRPPLPQAQPASYKGLSMAGRPAVSRNLVYPIVYKPKIITQQKTRPEEEIDVTH